MNPRLAIAWCLALSACVGANTDLDGDGLSRQVEVGLGLDPDAADSDGDGIDDGAELDAGLDPLAPDTDGDGMDDGEEIAADLDPLAPDTDDDGLDDGDEIEVGADPLDPDTDGDRLLDGEEIELGIDPTVEDTDGDAYTDGDEVYEESDPDDPKSRIYEGRWPYYFEKTEIVGQGGDTLTVGKRFKRLQMIDQHGDEVDLYDFYNADKPVVIQVSAEWCPPCNALAGWLDGESDAYYGGLWPSGQDAVQRGDVYWITVLGETNAGVTDGTGALAARWFDQYPTKQIPVLDDPGYIAADYVGLAFWPTAYLLEPDLTVSDAATDGSVESVLAELNRRFP